MSNQCWGPEDYNKGADFVPLFGRPVIELLDPKRKKRYLTSDARTAP